MKPYNPTKAFFHLFRASVISLLKAPSHVLFNLIFPIVLLVGIHYFSLSDAKQSTIRIGIIAREGIQNTPIYQYLSESPLLNISLISPDSTQYKHHFLDEISAIITLPTLPNDTVIHIIYNDPSAVKKQATIQNALFYATEKVLQPQAHYTFSSDFFPHIRYLQNNLYVITVLAFIVFTSSIFGVAFTFFALKKDNIFKLIFSTPIRKFYIILAEISSRLLFIMINALIIIGIGLLGFHLYFSGGLLTVLQLLCFLAIGILTFISYGFLISCLAKSMASVPAIANMIIVPQWALGELFFKNTIFPTWIQKIADYLPFTNFTRGLKAMVLENLTLWDITPNIIIIVIWGAIGFFLSHRLFKIE